MRHRKVRIGQRNRRAGGDIMLRPDVDRNDPKVKKGCINKRGKYRNRKWAASAAARATKKYGIVFHSYHCSFCGRHHISTHPKRDLRFRTKELKMNPTTRILTAISSTEPSSFSEILSGLNGDRPQEKSEFRTFFETIRALESAELIEVDWTGDRLNSAILTPLGAERAREALKGQHNEI